jgi:hypothetical protein
MLLPLLLKTSKQAEEEGQKPRVIFTTSRRHAMALPAGGIAFVTLKTPQLDTPGYPATRGPNLQTSYTRGNSRCGTRVS